jgi:hypothetical protein
MWRVSLSADWGGKSYFAYSPSKKKNKCKSHFPEGKTVSGLIKSIQKITNIYDINIIRLVIKYINTIFYKLG